MNNLPLYSQITIWFIYGSTALCFLLVLCGVLRQRIMHTLPAVPLFPGSSFPHPGAYIYTGIMMLIFMLSSVISIKSPEMKSHEPLELIASMVIQIALYLPCVCMYFILPRRNVPASPLLTKIWWVCKALLILWGCSAILHVCRFDAWLIEVTQCPPVQDVVDRMLKGPDFEKGMMALMAVLVAPVTEECFFRGFIYNILKRWNGRILATLASALLFASVHGSLMQMMPLTIFGIVQCFAYEKSRSLWLPIVIHTVFNACSCLLILIAPELLDLYDKSSF